MKCLEAVILSFWYKQYSFFIQRIIFPYNFCQKLFISIKRSFTLKWYKYTFKIKLKGTN